MILSIRRTSQFPWNIQHIKEHIVNNFVAHSPKEFISWYGTEVSRMFITELFLWVYWLMIELYFLSFFFFGDFLFLFFLFSCGILYINQNKLMVMKIWTMLVTFSGTMNLWIRYSLFYHLPVPLQYVLCKMRCAVF